MYKELIVYKEENMGELIVYKESIGNMVELTMCWKLATFSERNLEGWIV